MLPRSCALLLCLAATSVAVGPLPDTDDPLPPGAIARIGSARFRFLDAEAKVRMSPNGAWLAVYNERTVSLLDATGKRVQHLRELGRVNGVRFSADSRTLAIGTEKRIHLLDVEKRRVVREQSIPERFTWNDHKIKLTEEQQLDELRLDWWTMSDDGRVLASVRGNIDRLDCWSSVGLWDAVTGQKKASGWVNSTTRNLLCRPMASESRLGA